MKTNSTNNAAELSPFELPLEQRAERALDFIEVRGKLIELSKQSESLINVETDDNLSAAKAAHKTLVSMRNTIKKTGKAARDEANKYSKLVISKEDALISIIEPEEKRLDKLITYEEKCRQDRLRAVREEQEARARKMEQQFSRLRMLGSIASNSPLHVIEQLITEAQAVIDNPSDYEKDMQEAAVMEARIALNTCKAARDKRIKENKDAEELAEFRRLAAEAKAKEQQEANEAQARANANMQEIQRATAVVSAQKASQIHDLEDDDIPAFMRDEEISRPSLIDTAGNTSQAVHADAFVELVTAANLAYQLLVKSDLGSTPEAKGLIAAIRKAQQ